jgi:branched-chain amino acid transport system ATP-binding protein
MALLELQKLVKTFGGLTAVDQFDMTVEKGEIVGLIGPNGAGKTTVFNSISGVYRPNGGKVLFKDKDITGLNAYSVVKRGLVRTFQVTTIFSDLTVLENIRLGSHLLARIGFWADIFSTPSQRRKEKQLFKKAAELADFVGLGDKRNETAKNLSHGHQRLLEVAIALAADPELLMLDEPVAGMSAEETQEMMKKIRNTRDRGITILLVEHDMKMVMDICTRIYVVDFGKKLAEGTPQEICANPAVIAAYLGSEYHHAGN